MQLAATYALHAKVNGMTENSDASTHPVLQDARGVAKALVRVLQLGGEPELVRYATAALQELSRPHYSVHAVAECGAIASCVALCSSADCADTLHHAAIILYHLSMDSRLPSGYVRSYADEVYDAGAVAPLAALLPHECLDVARAAADALRGLLEEALERDDVPVLDAILGSISTPVSDHLSRRLRAALQQAARRSSKARIELFGDGANGAAGCISLTMSVLDEHSDRMPEDTYRRLANALIGRED